MGYKAIECEQCILTKRKRTIENCVWLKAGDTLRRIYGRIYKPNQQENAKIKNTFDEAFNGKM